jgi:hypothetical protein
MRICRDDQRKAGTDAPQATDALGGADTTATALRGANRILPQQTLIVPAHVDKPQENHSMLTKLTPNVRAIGRPEFESDRRFREKPALKIALTVPQNARRRFLRPVDLNLGLFAQRNDRSFDLMDHSSQINDSKFVGMRQGTTAIL